MEVLGGSRFNEDASGCAQAAKLHGRTHQIGYSVNNVGRDRIDPNRSLSREEKQLNVNMNSQGVLEEGGKKIDVLQVVPFRDQDHAAFRTATLAT